MKLALIKQTAQAVKQTGKATQEQQAAAKKGSKAVAAAATGMTAPGADSTHSDVAVAGPTSADQQAVQQALDAEISTVMQLYNRLASKESDTPAEQIFRVSVSTKTCTYVQSWSVGHICTDNGISYSRVSNESPAPPDIGVDDHSCRCTLQTISWHPGMPSHWTLSSRLHPIALRATWRGGQHTLLAQHQSACHDWQPLAMHPS